MLISKLQRRFRAPFLNNKEVLLALCDCRDLIKAFRKKADCSAQIHHVIKTSCRLANTYKFNLAMELARRFPGYCSYCTGKPCFCGSLAEKPVLRLLEIPPDWWETLTLKRFQTNQSETYPQPTGSAKDTMHFAEEVLEILEVFVLNHFNGALGADTTKHIIEETCDLFERAVCIAISAGIETASLFAKPA